MSVKHTKYLTDQQKLHHDCDILIANGKRRIADLERWKQAAMRVGEELASVGPNGYGSFNADQWREWALKQIPYVLQLEQQESLQLKDIANLMQQLNVERNKVAELELDNRLLKFLVSPPNSPDDLIRLNKQIAQLQKEVKAERNMCKKVGEK